MTGLLAFLAVAGSAYLGLRVLRREAPRVLLVMLIFAAGAVFAISFPMFLLTYPDVGGSALEGFERRGHCFLYDRGHLKEVACAVFADRRGLEILAFATGAVTAGAAFYIAQMQRKRRGPAA